MDSNVDLNRIYLGTKSDDVENMLRDFFNFLRIDIPDDL